MKTPREVFKEHFWIGAKGGLLDAKHYMRMRTSVWLFLYLLRNQTALNAAGEGIANYGHPLTFEEIGADMKGIPVRTIREWTARLKREGYIRTEYHGHGGLTFWIAKGKAKTRKVKFTTEEARSLLSAREEVRLSQRRQNVGETILHRHQSVAETLAPRLDSVTEAPRTWPQTLAAVTVAGVSETPTTKGSISENPSYYNKDSRAKTACFHIPSFKEVLKEKTVPRQTSEVELDARRRKLLLQGEEIIRKHSPKEQPRSVVQIQPQEVTA